MTKEKKLPKLYILWRDSCSFAEQHWRSKDDCKGVQPALIETIGQLLEETKDYITLVMSHSLNSGNVSSDITIPKNCIMKRKKVYV